MFKRNLLKTVAAAALLVGAAMPAQAVSIMYFDSFASLIEPGIKAYEAATGEKVDAIVLPGEGYVARVALDLSAGTAADVIELDSFVVSELAGAGYLEPLDDLATTWDQYQYYAKGPLEVASFDGHLYALPTDSDVRMLWYNKAAFTKAGIAMPWTPKSWADIIAAGEKLKAAGIENAFWLPAGVKRGEAATMQGFYMALLGSDTAEGDRNRLRDRTSGKWIGDSPGIRKVLEFYREVYVNKALTPGALNYTADAGATTRDGMQNGTIGILASGSWENSCLFECSNPNPPTQEEKDKIVGWTPWPGSGLEGSNSDFNISGGWTIGINAKAKDKEAARKLLLAIFDKSNFGPWTIENRRMAVRSDIATSPQYLEDSYLASATALAANTTGRDTVPGYQKVSALIQQATGDVLDGRSVEEVVKEYHDALVDEFGEENVITLQ
ncbi:MAG: extracellular solute-binding protein [Devosia sp.]